MLCLIGGPLVVKIALTRVHYGVAAPSVPGRAAASCLDAGRRLQAPHEDLQLFDGYSGLAALWLLTVS